MKISREELLNQLEAVQPGLSPKGIIEQSSCFIFKRRRIITYNDEISCTYRTTLNVEGAVHAEPLLNLLRKLKEEEVEITVNEKRGELFIRGRGRKAGVRMEKEITLPFDVVDKPMRWQPLHQDFSEAVKLVRACAGRNASQYALTCIHLHPKHVEAGDGYQFARFPMKKSGIKSAILVRADTMQHVAEAEPTEYAQSESWVHFRNSSGLVLSARVTYEKYMELKSILKSEGGTPTTLPKGLGEAAAKAEIFSAENTDTNMVLVRLSPGRLIIKGEGPSGWYQETKRLKYDGPSIKFMTSPKILIDITKQYYDCKISTQALRIDTGRYLYSTCLDATPEEEGE